MKRMIKTLLISALCICMLLAATPNLGSPVFAAEIVDSGYCGGEGDGTNLTWTLDSDGLLTISGTGEMEDNPWPWSAREAIERDTKIVLIESGIFNISDWAFENFSNLTNITIPETVTSIGLCAFRNCKSLTYINIPNSVTSIDCSAFEGCKSLTEFTIPVGVTSIEDNTFDGCTTLSAVTIPNSVTNIDYSAFCGCTNLTDIKIPFGVKNIGSHAFEKCENLSVATIPDSVTNIGFRAFYSCKSLTNIAIPNNVTNVGEEAFGSCDSLISVTIGDNVTSIEGKAFLSKSLTRITVSERNSFFSSDENGVLFNKTKTKLIQYPIGKKAFDYIIPDSVTDIGVCAFWNCMSLTSITIPDGVTNIGKYAFFGCESLTSITIPDSVTSIGEYAFCNCRSLASIMIPDSVTSIEFAVFEGCTSLASVTIPESVMSIGNLAFIDCESLTDVYYMGSEAQWKQIEIADGKDSLLNATIHFNHTHTPGQPVETVLKAATCGEAGEKKLTVTCTVCGNVISETTEIIPATGAHTFGDWIVKVPATVDAEGEETRTCSVCGATESRAIPKQEKPDEPVPAIDTDTLQESDGAVYAAPEQTVAALLTAAGEGATLTNADGSPTAPDAILSSGMVLVKPDGTKKTVIVKGDNDGDGRITASDARNALRAAVELESPNAWQKDASLVADGTEITAADARLILRAAVGLEALKLR